jgi:putative NADH-flavin reductase
MKILVLGATGRTGKHIVEYALSKGYQVNCLVRNPEKIPSHSNLKIIKGSTTKTKDLEMAMEGCTAIVSALNISRTSDFPLAPLRTPKDFLSNSITYVISVAEKYDIKRIVVCSAWGVSETRKDIPFWFRWTIDYSNIKYAYQDHERQELLLENSNLDWTIIKPVGLTNSKAKKNILESFKNKPKPNLLISRKNVAKYMVDSLEKDNLIGLKATISDK